MNYLEELAPDSAYVDFGNSKLAPIELSSEVFFGLLARTNRSFVRFYEVFFGLLQRALQYR